MDERPTRAPDYTAAFLVTTGVTLFMAFFTLAAVGGTLAVAIGVVIVDVVIRFIDRLRTPGDGAGLTPPR